MSKVFGFEDAIKDMKRLQQNAKQAKVVTRQYAEKIAERAKRNAEKAGLVKSRKGVEGIRHETSGDKELVGWAERPNFHLYFHEMGFHALDNRNKKKYTLKRSQKNLRKRSYKNVKATYIAPKPHVRPAFDELIGSYYKDVQKKIEQ